jgi:hypothetical protein
MIDLLRRSQDLRRRLPQSEGVVLGDSPPRLNGCSRALHWVVGSRQSPGMTPGRGRLHPSTNGSFGSVSAARGRQHRSPESAQSCLTHFAAKRPLSGGHGGSRPLRPVTALRQDLPVEHSTPSVRNQRLPAVPSYQPTTSRRAATSVRSLRGPRGREACPAQSGFSPTRITETPCQNWARRQFRISRGWLHCDL